MLPRINGIEVCRQLRLKKQTPIIMLTARDEVIYTSKIKLNIPIKLIIISEVENVS